VAPSLDFHRLFNPDSIAVVGASNKPGKMGNLFIQRLAAGFRGALYAVNPGEDQVAGVATHRSIEDVPGPIDLLIALVPATSLVALVETCRTGQVRFLAAIPSGFAEVSEDGQTLQRKLAAAARSRGMRVLGPNIVGIMNGVLGLNASMMPELPPGGPGLSCLTQSGGFGMALSMYALDHDLHLAKFCDLGNTCDVDIHEMLGYLGADPDTRVIGLFLESVRDQALFLRALETAAASKPVILTSAGVTAAGRRASLAHLGIAASALALENTLPSSVIVTDTGLDLLHCAKALMWQPRARGRRVAILTGTGGIGAEIADLAVRHGLDVPSLSPQLQKRLRRHLPYYAGVQNPVDCTPIWWDYTKVYPLVLEELAASGEIDLAIVSVTDVAATLSDLASALATWSARRQSMPIVVYWGARHRDHDNMMIIERAFGPCYQSTSEAVRGAAALAAG
jgi:acetyl-CoA synthetase (ADP-forming)